MVPEQIIESVIDNYASEEKTYVQDLAEIMELVPALLAFLDQESINILKEDEKDILWYIVLIMYKSIEKSEETNQILEDTTLSENEEKNWTIYQAQPRGTFRDRITVFFEIYPQEDLLAFVEDTLELEESSPMTNVGREVIFIAAKSIIDTLLPTKY
mgnify:CR=1 FL=1